jgi:transcriptional regulator with XRE-family HTH domain
VPTLPDDSEWLARERRAIGDRIRVERMRQNRTQESVFLAADISRSAYQAIEAGTADARITTLLKIGHVLGVHVTDLLRDRSLLTQSQHELER